jgi:hypothetical protein
VVRLRRRRGGECASIVHYESHLREAAGDQVVLRLPVDCGVVWCGVAWSGVVWCGVVRCGVVCAVRGVRCAVCGER